MNPRFSEYATSGAFTLSLTRNQVSSLGMLDTGMPGYFGHQGAALERKGLAEAVPAPTPSNPEAVEWRATHAGLLTAALCREAGLTNGPPDPMAVELAQLRAELVTLRSQAAEACLVARSAIARRQKSELDRENDLADVLGEKMQIRLLHRDPLEELSDDDLIGRLAAVRGWHD